MRDELVIEDAAEQAADEVFDLAIASLRSKTPRKAFVRPY